MFETILVLICLGLGFACIMYGLSCRGLKERFEKKETEYQNVQKRVDFLNKQLAEKAIERGNLQNEHDEALAKIKQKHDNALAKIKQFEITESRISELNNEINFLQQELLLQSVSISEYDNITSDECKNKLQSLKIKQDELTKSGNALLNLNYSTNKTIENDKKQILRCFNAECMNTIDSVTVKNVDTCRNKIKKSFDAINKIFETDQISISTEYFELKLEELLLVYAYMVKQEQEREIQRAIREQLIEEEKVRKEIEREKSKIEKEEQQFKNEINKLMEYMSKSKDEIQSKLYIDKIAELEEKLRLVEKDKENVFEREQNTRAGFVYIISNIGSFGENIYKVGMTRRFEPMDRIKELSSASVPFSFDVHAMIFSQNAPDLEALLHRKFKDNQVNRINPRKEFYNIDLNEIESFVLENHNSTVEFIREPEALEYRESVRMTIA